MICQLEGSQYSDWILHKEENLRNKLRRGLAKNYSRRLAGNFISCDFPTTVKNAYTSKIVNHQWILLVLFSSLFSCIWFMTWPFLCLPIAENILVISIWVFRFKYQAYDNNSAYTRVVSQKNQVLSWQSWEQGSRLWQCHQGKCHFLRLFAVCQWA